MSLYVIWCYNKTNELKLNTEYIKLYIIVFRWLTISRYLVLLFLLRVISEAKMSVDHRGCRSYNIRLTGVFGGNVFTLATYEKSSNESCGCTNKEITIAPTQGMIAA